ncbi:unnamed protein product [Rhizophagus irregularis]|nr:unnamed protein product [Rhizophagus irregularis]
MFNQIKLTDEPTDEPTDESTDDQTKFVFGIRNGRVWKSKFNEKMSKTIFSSEISVHSFNLYMDTVSTNFLKAINDNVRFYSPEETGNLIKWNIHSEAGNLNWKFSKKGKLINTRIENFHYPYKYGNNDFRNDHELIESSLFNNNDIIILTTIGILIYTFSEKDKSIILNYFYYIRPI